MTEAEGSIAPGAKRGRDSSGRGNPRGVRRALPILAIAFAARAEAQPEPGWELHVPERIELAPGGTGTLSISIAVDRGQTISKDGGIVLDLAPEAGVSVKRRRLGRPDAVDPDADAPRFAIPLRAEASGDFTIKLHARFWLCGTKMCHPIDARRSVTVSITAPPQPPPAPADASIDAPADRGPPSLRDGHRRSRVLGSTVRVDRRARWCVGRSP